MEQKAEVSVETQAPPEITKIQLERDLANKKEEVARGEAVLEEHKIILKEFEELLPFVKQAVDELCTPEMCKVKKPVFAFEESDLYAELISKQKRIEYLQQYYSIKDKTIKGLKDTVKAKEDTITDLKEKIAKMESE